MKPFLLLQLRPEDAAAENEYESFVRFSGLGADRLDRLRVEDGKPFSVNLDAYAGVLVGGGPYNMGSPADKKSPAQRACEANLMRLLDEIVARDFPFLGVCYGVGLLAAHQGGVVNYQFPEPAKAVGIHLTKEAADEPILRGLPTSFKAFVGHKESCAVLPPSATLLAYSADCPVQMFRVGKNLFAAQFHPELDSVGLALRIKIYKDLGYFHPDEADDLIAAGHAATVTEPEKILQNFTNLYG